MKEVVGGSQGTGRPSQPEPDRLDRTGRRLVLLGGFVVGSLTVLAIVAAASFFAYFGDDSGDCDAACQTGNPPWYVAVVLIVIVMLGFARLVRGGSNALVLGGLWGTVVALSGLVLLWIGGHGPVDATLVVAAVGGGLALAIGAAARLRARHAFAGIEPYPPPEG
jgi:hypothetical protein